MTKNVWPSLRRASSRNDGRIAASIVKQYAAEVGGGDAVCVYSGPQVAKLTKFEVKFYFGGP